MSGMKKDAVISISDLHHSYGPKKIYAGLDLEIEPGTIFGLLGKNGVGKSTLINLLMGYLKPQKGECLIFGEPANYLSPETRARIALLYEGFISYDSMSIEQVEVFFSSFYPKWQKKYFQELIDLMDISMQQPLSSLSFGQKSQVVLGLLLAQDADLLILDDYSMGLDAGYRRLFVDYLDDYLNGTDKTVLITTHVMSDLESLVDQIAIVDRSTNVFKSSMKEFNDTFRCYTSDELTEIPDSPLIQRKEVHRQQPLIYTFSEKEEMEKEMSVPLTEIPMSFEERFLGYVGKY
ncbi:ABC transporter ATP-binding protein [Vibrio sp. JC009]|uniref:ATP-binding cassette domain-containing protein n=1 Tax=Vibrio sp. JC009 TaxID=2912314 RepID=UPI0023B052F2|nr:ABC transporter ATP-binding protein [Vibrio sp. JC009]WED24680.1 ABC transporter ATP-binding protein [Vibrio sp. JC009]